MTIFSLVEFHCLRQEELTVCRIGTRCVTRGGDATKKKSQLNHINPDRPEPVEGLNRIYGVHPTVECEETCSCFDWALKKQLFMLTKSTIYNRAKKLKIASNSDCFMVTPCARRGLTLLSTNGVLHVQLIFLG